MTSRPSSLRRVVQLGAISAFLLLAVMLQTSEASIVLAWDPSPESEVIGYRVYVGTEQGVYAETYDVPSDQTWFVYTNSRGGLRYYFAVAARAEGDLLSPLSEEVTGIARFPSSTADATDPVGDSVAAADLQCVDAEPTPCLSATLVATGLGTVSSLAATGDGRVLFVEDQRRVRILTESTQSIHTALDVGSSSVQLTDLTVDPAFAQSGLVFVGESTIRTDGSRDLSIVRYRELGGTLGEGASVVGRMRLPPAGRAPFAVDAERNVYVAVPAESGGNRRGRDAFAGQVLGFTAEGRTLPLRAGASPVIAPGGPQPSALAWDRVARRLWVAGAEGSQSAALAHIDLASPHGEVRPKGVATGSLGFGASSFAIDLHRPGTGSTFGFLISSTRRLYRATLSPSGSLSSLIEISVTRFGEPVGLAVDPQHALFVAIRLWPARGESPRFAILKLFGAP